jgi:PAS domain S-box-containing protein
MRRGRGILRMVTSYVVIFSLSAMAVTSAILVAFGFSSYGAAVSSAMELSARYAADRVERYIEEQIDFLEAATWIEGNSLRADIVGAGVLDGILGYSPSILQLSAVDQSSGEVIGLASRRSKSAARAAGLPYSAEAAAKTGPGAPYLSPVYFDAITGELLITLGVVPFERFADAKILLIEELNLKFMWDLVAELNVQTGGRAYIVDSSGSLVAYDDPSRVLAHENLTRIPPVLASMANGGMRRPGKIFTFRGIEGDSVVGTYIPITTPPWAVIIERPWGVAYQKAIAVMIFGLIVVTVMMLFIYLIGRALAKRLSLPILSLADAVAAIAEKGDRISVDAGSPREIIELSESFNALSERLKRDEDRFQRLIWNSNDIIAVAGPDGVLSYVCASIERIYGYPPASVIGKPLADLLCPDDAPKAADVFASLLRAPGAIERSVFCIKTNDSRNADVEMIAVNRIDDPDIRGIVLNLHDVSERMKDEREKVRLQDRLQHAMKMEAVGRLAGGIAHDFNNLLTGIYGSVQLARMDADDPAKVEYYLNEIRKEAESAASLTRQLLAYSRKQPIETKLVDLNALILDVGGMLDRLIGEDVTIEFSLGQKLFPVRVDPGLFQQVLVNLCANSRDAMPKGGRLVIRTESAVLDEKADARHEGFKPGNYLRLTVEDNGIGMDEETLQHLFEPFYTTKSLGKGTGLGLAMVYGAIQQSEGVIEVGSEPGKGTSFSILLPMVSGSAEGFERPIIEGDPVRGTETLLLVEDKPAVMEVTARMFKKLGYEIVRAGGGEEALQILDDCKRIDALVTDISMPGMNGIELAEKARGLKPDLRVLFISGYAEEALRQEKSMRTLSRFVLKPYTIHALAAKIRETLDEA